MNTTEQFPPSEPAATPTPEPMPQPEPQQEPQPEPQPARSARPRTARPRTGPIIWGALILMFCAFVAVRTAGGAIDPVSWIITTVLGIGALLLIVGVVVLIRNAQDRR